MKLVKANKCIGSKDNTRKGRKAPVDAKGVKGDPAKKDGKEIPQTGKDLETIIWDFSGGPNNVFRPP